MGFLTAQAHGEQDVLATFLLQQLAQLRTTVHGLTDAQVEEVPSASAFSLAELLHHTGAVASSYAELIAAAPEPGGDYGALAGSVATPGLTLAERLADFDAAVERTREVVTSPLDLSTLVPVPRAPWFPPELTHWEVRWVLTHLVAELARHAGHADIVRESIDGAISYELNDRAEGKEPADWS